MRNNTNLEMQRTSLRVNLLEFSDEKIFQSSSITNQSQKKKQSNTKVYRKSKSQIKKTEQKKQNQQLENDSDLKLIQKYKQQKSNENKIDKNTQNLNYDMWDLTYTMIQSKISISISATLFFLLVILRYYTIACLIYISLNANRVDWLPIVIISRFFFILLVIKISLKIPETKTEIILKTHWNSMKSDVHQYFQILSINQLGLSIIRGIIPPELSFLYIKSQSYKKKYTIFVAINFIFYGIQAVTYYPFFIVYCYAVSSDQQFILNRYYSNFSLIIAAIAQFLIIFFSFYLLLKGIKQKYGKIL